MEKCKDEEIEYMKRKVKNYRKDRQQKQTQKSTYCIISILYHYEQQARVIYGGRSQDNGYSGEEDGITDGDLYRADDRGCSEKSALREIDS